MRRTRYLEQVSDSSPDTSRHHFLLRCSVEKQNWGQGDLSAKVLMPPQGPRIFPAPSLTGIIKTVAQEGVGGIGKSKFWGGEKVNN